MLNLTFGIALVLILFVLPGAFFRKMYNTSQLTNYQNKANTFSEIVITMAIGLLIQALAVLYNIWLCKNYPTCHPIDFKILGELFTSPTGETFLRIGKHFNQIFRYLFCICTISAFMGRVFLHIVIFTNLDEKLLMFRFENDWHYILSGEFFRTRASRQIVKYANVLINIDDDFIVYSGYISNYTKNKEGDLELIEMNTVKRKLISKGESLIVKSKENEFNVDKLFIPYKSIMNFSITYYSLKPSKEKE